MKLKPEEPLQIAIVDFWRLCGRTDVIMWHTPNELARTEEVRLLQARMGLLAGVPDLFFLPPSHGCAYALECKGPCGGERPEQLAFADQFTELGHSIRTVRTLGQAENALAFWGLLRRDTLVMERCG